MRRAALLLLMLLVLGGCGDDDGGDAETTSSAPPSAETRSGGGAEATAPVGENGKEPTGGDSYRDGHRGATIPAPVDPTVDPASIRGARVTATGAVQTLPPSAEAQETAQENGYSSINSFGKEAAGEEATDITFALVQYLTARVEGDWATACARLYGVLRENLESSVGQPCPEAYRELMSRVPKASLEEQARIDVSSVRRGDSDRAFVVYKTPDTLSADMPMYVEDGVWKVGALEAYALTPDKVG